MRSLLIRLLCIASSAALFSCKRSPPPGSEPPVAESAPQDRAVAVAAEDPAASAAPRWTASSPDYAASLVVRGTAAAGCEATCARNGVTVWTRKECFEGGGEGVFPANDCQVVLIVHSIAPLTSGGWRDSPAVEWWQPDGTSLRVPQSSCGFC